MIKSRQMNLVWRLRVQEVEYFIKNVGRGTFKEKSIVTPQHKWVGSI
jgi:hypothetical protein